jgi:hypothetical protein
MVAFGYWGGVESGLEAIQPSAWWCLAMESRWDLGGAAHPKIGHWDLGGAAHPKIGHVNNLRESDG